jgi:hypothetical protein
LHLVANSHVDAVPFPEFFRSTNNELFFLVDDPADEIGDPSGGEGSVRTPFEDDDLQFWTAAPCLGGGAHPRCISTDNHQSFLAHDFSPSAPLGSEAGLVHISTRADFSIAKRSLRAEIVNQVPQPDRKAPSENPMGPF